MPRLSKDPSHLLYRLLTGIHSLSALPVITGPELESYPAEQIDLVRRLGLLCRAPTPSRIRCPERDCLDCICSVESVPGFGAFIRCPEDALPIILISDESLTAWQLNLIKLREFVSAEFDAGLGLVMATIPGRLPCCFGLGKILEFGIADDLCLMSGDIAIPFVDVLTVDGLTVHLDQDRIRGVINGAFDEPEKPFVRRVRYCLWCRQLTAKFGSKKAAMEFMAQEEGCSYRNIRRVLDEAEHDDEVQKFLTMARSSKNPI